MQLAKCSACGINYQLGFGDEAEHAHAATATHILLSLDADQRRFLASQGSLSIEGHLLGGEPVGAVMGEDRDCDSCGTTLSDDDIIYEIVVVPEERWKFVCTRCIPVDVFLYSPLAITAMINHTRGVPVPRLEI